jgi:hypothetical protein
VAGTGPAFSAYQSSAQTLTSGTVNKLFFQTEEFDTNSNFNNTGSAVGSNPAYAFLPTVAGYYQVSGRIEVGAAVTGVVCYVYKNGIRYKIGVDITANSVSSTVSVLVFLNGSTDYVELYGYLALGQVLATGIQSTYFQAAMVRSA